MTTAVLDWAGSKRLLTLYQRSQIRQRGAGAFVAESRVRAGNVAVWGSWLLRLVDARAAEVETPWRAAVLGRCCSKGYRGLVACMAAALRPAGLSWG